MEFKICSKCEVELPATTEFFHKGNGKLGLRSRCKDCQRKWRHKYRQTDKAKELEKVANKRYKKSEKGKVAVKRYDQSDKGRVTQKRWRESKAGKVANRRYIQSEKGKVLKGRGNKKYRLSEKGKAASKKYYENNKLSSCISHRMGASLKNNKAGQHWEDVVGYTLEELKDHIENLFEPGMSWGNYGRYGWHVDHKIPVSSFNIESYNCEDFKKCWELKNLQPLWAKDNLRKGNKVNYNGK